MGARVTVDEFLAQLHTKFPRAKDWLIAWADSFRRVLAVREGEDLRTAYERTLDAWNEPGCPKPAHFAASLPPKDTAAIAPAKQPCEEADAARHARARQLEQAWTTELHAWFETARAEGWAGRLRMHLAALSAWCAQCDGRSIDEAITRFNGRDARRGHPLRAPGAIVDEIDATIWRQQQEAQARFNGLRRGERDAPWRLKRDGEAPSADPVAERLAQRRDELRARIPREPVEA